MKLKPHSHVAESPYGLVRVTCYGDGIVVRVDGPGVPAIEIRGAAVTHIASAGRPGMTLPLST